MDSSKYVNTYLDFAVGMIHEAVNDKLQLKTQLKLANDLVASRDQVISSLNQEIENSKKKSEEDIKVQTELDEERKKSKNWENLYNAVNNKVSHFDNLTNQFNDIKSQLINKNNELNNKSIELEALKKYKEETSKTINDLNNIKSQLQIKSNEIEEFKRVIVSLEQNKQLLEQNKEILDKTVSDLTIELNTLKLENQSLLKKLETSKKQINTTRKKASSSAQSLSISDFVESNTTQQKTENLNKDNNDF